MIRDVPAEVQVVDYYLPKDCTPQFDPMIPSKEEMIGKIGKAVENETRQLAWTGDPETVESVTANFNFDYPATEVFIPRFNKVFEVTLRDEPYRTKDVPSGAPAVRVEPNESMAAQDSARILKYGIRRTIRYGGQP